MTEILSDVTYFYFNGRKVSYYQDLIEDLTLDGAFEEDGKKLGQIRDRISSLQRREHAILKPQSLLEKVSYQAGRFVGS